MATKGDINATVGLGIKTESGALKGLNDQINTLIRQVQSTVTGALKETDKMSAANVAKLREFSKAINQTEQTIKTLERYSKGNRSLLDFLGNDEQLQKQAKSIRNVQEYRRTLEQTTTTTGALRARINELDKAQTNSALKGGKSLDTQIAQQNRLRDALKEFETIQKRIGNTSLQAGLLSGDSQAKLAAFVTKAQEAQNIFSRMAGDRRVFNFDQGLNTLKLATAEMEKQVRLLQQQDKQVKKSAEAILATNKFADKRSLIGIANQATATGNFQKGGSEASIAQRLERATVLYGQARAQLAKAVETDAGSDRLTTLISRYNALKQVIGQTIASQRALVQEEAKSGNTGFKIFEAKARQISQLNKLNEKAAADEAARGFKIFEARARQAAQADKLNIKDANAQAANATRLFEAKVRQIQMLEKLGNKEAADQARQASKLFEARAKQLRDLAALEEREANQRAKKAYDQFEAYAKLKSKQYKDEQKLLNQQPQGSKLSQSIQGLIGDGGAALGARVGIYALAASGIYGVMNAAREAAQFVVEFEDKLAQLQAISGSTNQQMISMAETITEVGKNSRFSAVEIADASIQLAQAGFSSKEMSESLGDITAFAAASGTGVKESVDLITGALGAFQLQASDTSRVTDILSAALNRSKLSSQQIAQAIQYVGTTAYEQNISLEQMVATVGSVAQAGVRAGSTLGTGFRQFIVDLANPTDKLKEQLTALGITMGDIDIKTKGLPAVLDKLKTSGFGAAQAYEGLEVRAAAFYLAAKNNIDVYEDLMMAESQQGTAMLANERAMDSLSAQWQRFKNILADIANDNAPLGFLKDMVTTLSDFIESSREASKSSKQLAQDFSNNGIDSFGDGVNKIFNSDLIELWTQAYVDSMQRAADSTDDLALKNMYLEKINNTVRDSLDELATATADANTEVATQTQLVEAVTGELVRIQTQYTNTEGNSIRLQAETANLTNRFEGLQGLLGNTGNAFDDLVLAMQRYNVEAIKTLSLRQQTLATASQFEQVGLRDAISNQTESIKASPGYRSLLPKQRARVDWALANPNDRRSTVELAEVANQLPVGLGGQYKDLNRNLLRVGADIGKNNLLSSDISRAQRNARQMAAVSDTAVGQRGLSATTNGRVALNKLRSDTAGMSAAERKALGAETLATLSGEKAYLEGASRHPGITPDQATAFLQQASELESMVGELKGIITPTGKENKAAERAAKAGERDAKRKAAEARRAQKLAERNNMTAASSRLTASGKSIDAFFNDTGNLGTNISGITKMFEDSDALIKQWIENRKAVLAAAIDKGDMNPTQIEEMTKAANEEIAAKQKDVYQKQMQAVANGFSTYITEQQRKMSLESRRALQQPTRGLALAEGTAQGLSNPLYNIPEYTQVIASRQTDLARQALNVSTYADNENKIRGNDQLIDKLEASLQSVVDSLGNDKELLDTNPEIRELRIRIEELRQSNEDLGLSQDALNNSIKAVGLKPKTFSEGLSQAAQAFGIQNNTGIGIDERMINGLGGAIESVHGAFQNFFTDLMTGTASVGQAFGNMAKSVVAAIGEMAAKAVATQIFGLLLSFIPGATPITGSTTISTKAVPNWNGGPIGGKTPKRLIGGGRVSNGLSTRDSTLVHAAEGEFMMKRSSVQSIGESLLSDMNNRGAQALKGLGDKNLIMPQSQLQSNVYVVLPEERPTLGPADVLAVVSRDVLRGGATKQLIKQVAAGG